jgi:16S rRNA (cytosine1402-N4)-methyltransferase
MDKVQEHIPVLVDEVLAGLQVQSAGRYIDATVGTAGHAASILNASDPGGQLLGLDTDPEAILYSRQILVPFGKRVVLQVANFRNLQSVAMANGFELVDGILMDLGFSSRQLTNASRGFSFSLDGPLDMRLDPGQSQTAADLVNRLPEAELASLLWRYGEERHARRIARAVVDARPVVSTGQLAELVAQTVRHRERIHPATRTFQALRIAVNNELENLVEALPQARDLLRPGGRLVVISFHSLEDRVVKRFVQRESRDCICSPETLVCDCQHQATLRRIGRKPTRPSEKEITANPRSRSARLRVAERRAH